MNLDLYLEIFQVMGVVLVPIRKGGDLTVMTQTLVQAAEVLAPVTD